MNPTNPSSEPRRAAARRNGLNGHAAADAASRHPASPGLARPHISIIVPALNEHKLIGKTLECFPEPVRLQFGIELIVSDGGSTDETVEIARRHADIVVEHAGPRRQTIAEGRNRGAERATGHFLVFINADTVPCHPESFVRELFEVIAETDGGSRPIVAVACPVKIAPEERRFSDRLFYTFFNNYVHFLNIVGLGMGRGECQIVRHESFSAVGGYNNGMAAGEDFDLYRRLHRHGRIAYRAKLTVYESPRRFRRYGYLRILAQWTANAVAVMVLKRSMSTEWEQVR